MNNFFNNLKFAQLGLILIASLAANLFSITARAETPNCVEKYINKRADIDSATFAFGNYSKAIDGSCKLSGGEGTQVSFNLSETLKMIHIKKISYPNTDVEIFAINDVFDNTEQARNVPPWVSKYLFVFKEESKRVAPKFFAEFELSATLKQKRLDEENAAKAREQAAKDKTEKDKQQAQTTADLAQLRHDITKMNAGQLFAKADELNAQGDTAKARETLRMLISKFPDHPLVAPAAQQLATISAASANAAANNSSNAGSGSSGGSASVVLHIY